MILVLLESPYAGGVFENVEYARACMVDSLRRGEAPFASHLLYPRVLNDDVLHERALGIQAGLVWGMRADKTVVYLDRGISRGMMQGIHAAMEANRPIELRRLGVPASVVWAPSQGSARLLPPLLELLFGEAQEPSKQSR